jgi:4-amino-4-deoxy-L-arabinose transferase-like glycosyltransferase
MVRHGPGVRYGVLAPTLLICAIAVAARSFALFTSSIDVDEGVYLVTAQQWLHGGLPYLTVWDQHPPGLPALLTVMQMIVPDPVLGARLAAIAAVSVVAITLFRFCRDLVGETRAGWLAALLYIMCVSRWPALSANTEIFNNACVAFAAYQLYRATRGPGYGVWRALSAALILGIGLQFKYVVFPEATLLCLGYLAWAYTRGSDWQKLLSITGSLMLLGCLPTAAVALYFWRQGALQPFLDANIGSNLNYVSISQPLSAVLHHSISGVAPIVAAGCLLGYAAFRHQSWRAARWPSPEGWILLWVFAASIDAILPLKFFTHYFFALYPPICLGGALALARIAGDSKRTFVIGAAFLFIVAVPSWLLGVARAAPWNAVDVPRTIAALIRSRGGPDPDMYVYKYQPSVYALAHAHPPTPYVLTLELSEFGHSAGIDGADEVRRVMATHPRFVVERVEQGSAGPTGAAMDEEMAKSLADYHLVGEWADNADESRVRLYER